MTNGSAEYSVSWSHFQYSDYEILFQCCIENLDVMASLLIKNGADLRAADLELWTPLHAAATCGLLSMVRILIESAKQQNAESSESSDIVRDMLLAVNSDGNMPFDLCDNDQTLAYIEHEMQLRGKVLDVAYLSGLRDITNNIDDAYIVGITQDDIESKRHKKEVDMLRDLQLFVDTNFLKLQTSNESVRRRGGIKYEYRKLWEKFMTASKVPNSLMMHIAAANGYLDVIDLLLKYNYPVDLEDDDGWLPVHAAVAWNQVCSVTFLHQFSQTRLPKVLYFII